jgi:hypothetical protein
MLSYNSMRPGTDFVELGPVPIDEDCTQIGDPEQEKWGKIECRAYINQLKRQFPEETMVVQLDLIRNVHDAGIYYEVGAPYRDDNEEQEEAAFYIENNLPNNWDDEAIIELELAEHPLHYAKIISIKTA